MNIPLNIDLQQILLHLFNFAILAGGLYLLLYKPVEDFLEKRRAYFRELEETSERKLREAEEMKASCQRQLQQEREEIQQERARTLQEAEESAKQRLEKAKAQGDQIVSGARAAAQRAQEKAMQDTQQQLRDLTAAALEKLVLQSVSESYDRFLEAAEEEESHEGQT